MEKTTTSTLRRMIDQNRREEREKYLTDYQERSRLGPEALARHLDRRCPYCQELLIPTMQPDLWRGGDHQIAIWPDEHGCEAEKKAQGLQAVREAEEQVDRWSAEYNKRLEAAGLLGWLKEATFDSFEAREDWPEAIAIRDRVMTYTQAITGGNREKPFLVLYGQYGNGKSHLAAASIRWFVDLDWRKCCFRVWSEYLNRITATFSRRDEDHLGETEADIIAELQAGAVVCIDDLDKRKPSDWVRSTLFPVLNHRYNAGLPTILTFNYGFQDTDPKAPGRLFLEEYLGRAVIDRIIGATYDFIEFSGPSYRSNVKWGAK